MTKLFVKFQFIEQNKIYPDRLESVGVTLCLLRCIYTFADSRGRLSLQGEFKLPYGKEALIVFFCFLYNLLHKTLKGRIT